MRNFFKNMATHGFFGGSGGSGGGGGIFRINVTVTGEGISSDLGENMYNIYFDSAQGSATVDKTYAEIEQAVASGLFPIVLVTQHFYEYDIHLVCTLNWHNIVSYNGEDENIYYVFCGARANNGGADGIEVIIRKNGMCEVVFSGHSVESLLRP